MPNVVNAMINLNITGKGDCFFLFCLAMREAHTTTPSLLFSLLRCGCFVTMLVLLAEREQTNRKRPHTAKKEHIVHRLLHTDTQTRQTHIPVSKVHVKPELKSMCHLPCSNGRCLNTVSNTRYTLSINVGHSQM